MHEKNISGNLKLAVYIGFKKFKSNDIALQIFSLKNMDI